jgi:hypothetical protein
MAKIRGFKSDLWTDEDFVEVSAFARLLWMGMWNFACDNGHLPDKSKQIKMRVLPTDDVNCAELLRELEAQGLIERDNGWITVPNLTRHQKPDKRWWLSCEKPGCAKPETNSQHETHSGHHEPRSGQTWPRDELSGVDGDVSRSDTTASADAAAAFEEFWSRYPKKEGKGAAVKAWKAATKKAEPSAILAGLDARVASWSAANTERKFIPLPTTWLNQERWTDEIDRPRIVNPNIPEGWGSLPRAANDRRPEGW